VYNCTHWLSPRISPSPHIWAHTVCEGAIAIGQPRQTTSLSNPLDKVVHLQKSMRRAAILILTMAVLPAALGQRGMCMYVRDICQTNKNEENMYNGTTTKRLCHLM
jgi:hypothetical protein